MSKTPDISSLINPSAVPAKRKKPPADDERLALATLDAAGALARYFDRDALERVKLTKSDAARLMSELSHRSTGGVMRYLPMVCLDVECPVQKKCPIRRIAPELVPIGRECPVELMAIDHLYAEIGGAVREQMGTDFDTLADLLIDELVCIIIIEMRTTGDIAASGYTSLVPMVVVEGKGATRVVEKEELSPSAEFLLKVRAQKMKIMNALLATPEAKVKAGVKAAGDISRKLAESREKATIIEKLIAQIANAPAVDAEFEEMPDDR